MASVGSNPTLSAGRGAGVAYQARLESACRLGDRGFESHPLRLFSAAYWAQGWFDSMAGCDNIGYEPACQEEFDEKGVNQ